MAAQLQVTKPDEEDLQEEALVESGFVLQKLRPRHRDVCSLYAQGLKNIEVAAITGYTKEYVGILLQQPVCIEYIRRMNEVAAAQLELTNPKVVETVIHALDVGTVGEQLKAARLHAELTKRIGSRADFVPSGESSVDRLTRLAERLTGLLANEKGKVINGICEEVQGSADL